MWRREYLTFYEWKLKKCNFPSFSAINVNKRSPDALDTCRWNDLSENRSVRLYGEKKNYKLNGMLILN